MKLYLMQHGEAMPKEVHPERPLTERGKEDVVHVAEFLARSGVRIAQIRHSGKRRAEETAAIVTQYLHLQQAAFAISGIDPNDDVKSFAEVLQRETQSVMLVGHLPFLSRFVSYLLTGDVEQLLVQFQMGGVICLESQEGKWGIRWMVVPELFR
jgi:phosphohistidine phosphatase